MPKLLFVGPYPPPYGGIASHLNDILPALKKMGYESITLTTSLQDNRTISDSGEHIYFSPKKYLARNFVRVLFDLILKAKEKRDLPWREYFQSIILAKFVSQIKKQNNISAVYIYTITHGLAIPLIKKDDRLTPIFLMIFGAFYLSPHKYTTMPRYIQEALRSADKLIASSKYCGDSIKNIFNYEFHVKVIYIGVDLEIFNPNVLGAKLQSELKIPPNSNVLLFLGRMDKSMGLDSIIQIHERIRELDPSIYLVIAGAEGALSQKVSELSKINDWIKYCPNIPFERKPEYYALSDIFLAPTSDTHACMGVSIKEAMAMGKAIIASKSGGIPEAIVDDYNGYIIPFNNSNLDVKLFLEKIARLLSDENLRKEFGTKAKATVLEKFSSQQTITKYLDVINTIT